jgi:phosphoglucomutase
VQSKEDNWSPDRAQIEQSFTGLSSNADLVRQAVDFLEEWATTPLYAAQRDAIHRLVTEKQFALLLDSFYQMVPFGTGGRRGRVGFGPNRINPITVAVSVQGHCNFLRDTSPSPAPQKIVVAYDTRIFSDISKTYAFLGAGNPLLGLTSRTLARLACEIYAGNGFEVYIAGIKNDREYLSTPELSFSIRFLKALGGMNVSASHNHPDDNGFKFFNEHGAQDIPPTDQKMASYMGKVEQIQRVDFAAALADGRIRSLPVDLHPAYINLNLALGRKGIAPIRVVYTPLCGTGDGTVGDVLRAAGHDVQVYEPQNTYDGTFPTVPFRMPNPEVPEAASPALAMAKSVNADIVLCSDPDADRLGVFAKGPRGEWRYMNGNEIASVLAYYLCLDKECGPKRSGFLIKTLVTTRTIQRIAEQAGCPIVADLLVGFKYIADVLLHMEREGHFEQVHGAPRDLIIAGEESHGVLLTPEIRDKDAAGGALILCELVSCLKATNRFLPEYLDALSLQCGNYQNVARSIVMRGIKGVALLADMMSSLRSHPPTEFGSMPVLRSQDFLTEEYGPLRSETEKLSRNFLVYELEHARIVIRPSGTEPKAKIYVDLEGSKLPPPQDRHRALRAAQLLAAQVLEDCIGRLNYKLSKSAHMLPDYVDLDLKSQFDTAFRGDVLREAARFSQENQAAQLNWLRERLVPYGSGTDPLESTATAVAHLLGELSGEVADPAAAKTLRASQQAVASVPKPAEWVT